VERLSRCGIGAANLTSAGPGNSSTNNWTFTQSLIDGLGGGPLIDVNGDGRITLEELAGEVREAMRHREGQLYGFKAKGIAGDFVLARTGGTRPAAISAKFPIGSYVKALDSGRSKIGRVVAVNGERYTVQFYDYSEKRNLPYAEKDLVASTGKTAPLDGALDVGVKPDCEVEWKGTWYPARVLKTARDAYYIHYLGYDDSWDERVGKDRIRFLKKEGP
jgi:hypothetical protein